MAITFDKKLGSDSPCSVYVRPTHGFYGQGLRRRDLTAAFIARFHTKYQKSDGCWLWQAGKFRKGYGMVNLGRDINGKQFTTYAHRVAYVLAHGPIPDGQDVVVMHSCDTPACVNPAHLTLGTQADNVRDAAQKGRYHVPRTAQVRKLSDEQVREIRASTEKGSRLSIRYGVSQAAISLIRRGLARKAA